MGKYVAREASMTEYIKFPTFPTQDLLREVEAVSPYPRINPQQPRPEGYPQQSSDTGKKPDGHALRRFMALRRVIDELRKLAQITKVGHATADTELRHQGLTIVDAELFSKLRQLYFPRESLELLREEVERQRFSVNFGRGRKIVENESNLFPVSTAGLSEYHLRFEELKFRAGRLDSRVKQQIQEEGLCVEQQNRLRLIFSRAGQAQDFNSDLLKVKIEVEVGVVESDEADRRAILYPRGDASYGLYADKLINLSI
jgi:hypothetical protein